MIQVIDFFNNLIGEIRLYSGLSIQYRENSWYDLEFTVPANTKNNSLLQNESRLLVAGCEAVIKGVNPDRANDGSPLLKISAQSIASDLNYKPRQVVGTYIGAEQYSNWEALHSYTVGDRVKHFGTVYECVTSHVSGSTLSAGQWVFWTTCKFQQKLAEVVLPLTEMMALALANTGWSPGVLDDDGSARTFSGEWVSVPALLNEMAEKFDKFIRYNEDTRTVDMINEPGADRGVTIAYAKNLEGINKSSESTEFFTKLYVYGSEQLTFNLVNIHGENESPLDRLQDGQSFITNFEFFKAQGYSEEEIYESIMELGDASPFIRVGNLNLGDYVDEAQLLIEGRKQLDQKLSKPTVSYSVDFVDLHKILGYLDAASQEINLGDWVTVYDEELGVDIKVRVVSMRVFPGFPEKSSCELSNKDEFFANTLTVSAEYTSQLRQSPAVSNLMKGYINTFTTIINSGNGTIRWEDGQLTAVELDEEGTPTGKQVRLTPTGLGVSKDFGVTYDTAMTGEGVLANKVIADSIRILSVGSDGLIIEPNACGVRLNSTEGIVVQSEDKRFKATMKAQNTMGGEAYGFGLWNGDFDEYGEYTGDSLVFGVTMNGNSYFKGEVNATSGTFRGTVYASAGVFAGVVQATDFQDELGNSLLNPLGKWKHTMIDLGNIQIDGANGNIAITGDLTLGGASSNITLTGNINFVNGNITWGDLSSPVRVLYASTPLPKPTQPYHEYPFSGAGWHRTLDSSTDFYASYSYNGGTLWGDALRIQVQDSTPPDPPEIDYTQVNAILANTYGITKTEITPTTIASPRISGGEIFGAKIYAGAGTGPYTEMLGRSLNVYAYSASPILSLGFHATAGPDYPFITFGVGTDAQGTNRGMIKKFSNGLWIGDSDDIGESSVTGNGYGIFINFNTGQITFHGSVPGVRAQFA